METWIKTTHIIYSSVDSNEMEHRDQNNRADLDWEEQVVKTQNEKNLSNGQNLLVNYTRTIFRKYYFRKYLSI